MPARLNPAQEHVISGCCGCKAKSSAEPHSRFAAYPSVTPAPLAASVKLTSAGITSSHLRVFSPQRATVDTLARDHLTEVERKTADLTALHRELPALSLYARAARLRTAASSRRLRRSPTDSEPMTITPFAYLGAALAEIAGCFSFWAWLRLGKSPLWVVPGMVSLALFAWLLTLIDSDAAGRTYAAYGGVYIAASLGWLLAVEGLRPDKWDLTGATICLLGAAVILWGPRSA